jgi:hypothetical protein
LHHALARTGVKTLLLTAQASRFALYRDVDVSKPVRHHGLTLDEVGDILNTWKLRGPHGG